MVESTKLHPAHADVHILSAGAIAGICVGALVFFIALSVTAYKCYRRRVMRNAQNRLSSAIKKGLKESSSSKKSAARGHVVMKTSKGTSPISPPDPSSGPFEKIPPGSFSIRTEIDPARDHMKSDVVVADEKDGDTPEKEEKLRERPIVEKSPYLGSLEFSVEYETQKSALLVTIIRVRDLPPRDPSQGGSDPYVKLQLLPEKKHKCKTRVLRKTLNPIYDETFTFYGINYNQLPGITLHFVVLMFDRFSRDEIMGEVLYPLGGEEIGNKELSVCREITPRHLKFRSQGHGELLMSLCHQPAANRLTVVVLKARNLPKMDITGLSDPYVKLYLLYNGQRIAKKKTHVKKRTLNPVFNESFVFDVPYNEGLQNISLEVLILDWDRMTKNEVIGRLEIGVRVPGHPGHHWQEVMNCPRKQIAEWHKLLE
ncbi:hypothetical protein CHS0354_027771 [Potamilus streckersoni]|uniref:C2 domain-containing protein n=1 Tax=Potamilus streckersoni TaxID=2493646 RepID=A0AAE0W5G0_9BIVA|nr:hypothetical protein CHS0354_027771 [Potamilus streckersoni]